MRDPCHSMSSLFFSSRGACKTCLNLQLPPSPVGWPSLQHCAQPSCCEPQSWRAPTYRTRGLNGSQMQIPTATTTTNLWTPGGPKIWEFTSARRPSPCPPFLHWWAPREAGHRAALVEAGEPLCCYSNFRGSKHSSTTSKESASKVANY